MAKKAQQPVEELEDEEPDAVEEAVAEASAPVRKPRKRAPKKKATLDSDTIRGFSRECLVLLQSAVAVAIISYVAVKSAAWYLIVLAVAGKLLLAIQLMSYVASSMAWFDNPRSTKWIDALLALGCVLIAYVGLTALFDTVNVTLEHLIRSARPAL
jgi:hypothetical protein